jgi:hypothetical protein
VQVFKKLGRISTLWWFLLQNTVEWSSLWMMFESKYECQNYVNKGAQDMIVKTYIDNLKLLMAILPKYYNFHNL